MPLDVVYHHRLPQWILEVHDTYRIYTLSSSNLPGYHFGMLQRQTTSLPISYMLGYVGDVLNRRSILIHECAGFISYARAYVGVEYWCFPFNPWFSSECIAN